MTGQQLKNSILQLAIQGKLVPQNPDDEPASELLKRIRLEKEKLVKEKKIKKEKPLPEITDEEKPFEIPEGWVWCKLVDLCIFLSRGRSPKYADEIKQYPVFAQKCNLKTGGISLDQARFLDPSTIGKWHENYKLKNGDVLVNSTGTGTVGRTRLFNSECLGIYPFVVPDSHVSVVRTSEHVCSTYIYYCLISDYVQKYFEDNLAGSTNQKELYIGTLGNAIIPLPPLQEQRRIVQKIEELMPLVDEYDKAQKELNTLNANLPEALKKSILQEAIQGKLGTNNPDDEPASELLKRIREEKAKLIKEKKIKKEKPLPEITEDEKPFEIPENWVWCRLGDVVSNRAGLSYNKSCLEIKSNSMIRVLRGGNIDYGKWMTFDNDVMIDSQFVNEELILKKGMFITPAVTSLECMGKTALIEEDQTDIVVGGFVLMLSPIIHDKVLWHYLNLFFQSYYYKQYCQSITNKSGQAFFNISRAKLMECLIPLPPLQEQHRIVEKLNEILPKLKTM